jgi:hypothetical protein
MRFIAPLAILSVPAAASARGGITPENGHKVVADTLIQRCEKLLEEMEEEAPLTEGKTASQGLQMKMAKLGSDYGKFLSFRNLANEVRDELRPTMASLYSDPRTFLFSPIEDELLVRVAHSFEAVREQYEEMGGDQKFPMTWPQYLLYEFVDDINGFAQMSQEDQGAHKGMLNNLARNYRGALYKAQGRAGLDMTEFYEAGQKTLTQLRLRHSQL